MEQDVLKKQAQLFIEIIDNLNRIEKVIYVNEIVDSQSLFVDRDIFDSLCHKALKIYDIHPATILRNKDKYGGGHETHGLGIELRELLGMTEEEMKDAWHFNDTANYNFKQIADSFREKWKIIK